MKRPEWVKKMIAEGMSTDDIIEAMKKGNEKEGIKPVKGKDEKQINAFAKLIVGKIIKNSK